MSDTTTPATLVAGRYRLDSELGRGGMGVVWEAFDETLRRSVAVKEVRFPPELPAGDRERLAGRTLLEARAVAALDTPAAVRVYDIVEQDGRPWIVMELLRGTTLSHLISECGGLPEPEVARVGLALVDALEAAHAAGVLHRDVKPSNVLLGEDGRVALTDFGIATLEGDGGEATTGVVLGSPSYVAPERLSGERPTRASDYWALGATLWTALQGEPPYAGPTAYAVLSAVSTTDAPAATRGGTAVRGLLASLLARDPAERPSPATVRATLEDVLARPAAAVVEPTLALPVTTAVPEHFDRTTVIGAPTARPPRRRPEAVPEQAHRRSPWALLVLLAVVLLAATGTVLAMSSGRDRPAGSNGATQEPSRAASGAPTPSAAEPSAAEPSATAGAGLRTVSDAEHGWTLSVPDGWTRDTVAAGTRYADPAGGRYLLVATRDPAGPSAVGAWRDQEKSFRKSHEGYERLRLETVEADGAADAADWEFRYDDGGARLHALDHALVVDGRGYALYLQSRDSQWEESSALFDQVESSFRAGTDR